jgi:alpha-1,6-mannosyltransferase
VIFGDGPFKNAVKSAASKVPNIHIAGFTPDRNYLSAALASTDFMIHGSSAETYGLVVAEAICSGIPIVVPDIGGAHDLASPDYAEIYKSGSTNECSKAILRMLARDKKDIKDAISQKTNSIGTMDDHFVNLFNAYEKLVIEKKERLSL